MTDTNRIALIKAAAEKAREKREMKRVIHTMDLRKAKIKAETKAAMKLHKKLTKQVLKAGDKAPSSFECNKPENMYYSDTDTQAFIAGSTIMDAYNEGKNDWD
jgi:hypothetical protein